MGLRVIFSWALAHIGIRGNEMADKAAKGATKKSSKIIRLVWQLASARQKSRTLLSSD